MTLSILTLNLHSYQEIKQPGASLMEQVQNHEPLLARIAAVIEALHVDVVCLQEVAESGTEPLTTPYGQGNSNAARRIHQLMDSGERYGLRQDWSHYAWDTWREGTAILSKLPIVRSASKYVSRNQAKDWWKSRNILMAQVEHPEAGPVNIYSVHCGWWDDPEEPAQEQYRRLRAWADEEHGAGAAATFLCGDFNTAAGGYGYCYWTADAQYSDTYLLANPEGMHDPTISGTADGWAVDSDGQRIDYIFMRETSRFQICEARMIFTEMDYGPVSDHAAVYAVFDLAA